MEIMIGVGRSRHCQLKEKLRTVVGVERSGASFVDVALTSPRRVIHIIECSG